MACRGIFAGSIKQGRKSVFVQLVFLPLLHRLVEERVGEGLF
jgi:hypothetical protein